MSILKGRAAPLKEVQSNGSSPTRDSSSCILDLCGSPVRLNTSVDPSILPNIVQLRSAPEVWTTLVRLGRTTTPESWLYRTKSGFPIIHRSLRTCGHYRRPNTIIQKIKSPNYLQSIPCNEMCIHTMVLTTCEILVDIIHNE